MFADLADLGEAVLFEEFGGAAEEEPTLSLAAVGRFRDRFDQPPTPLGDLSERTAEGCPGDTFAAVSAIDEDAVDPPVGQRGRVLVVGSPVFDGQLLGVAVLGPALGDAGGVENECVVCGGARPPIETLVTFINERRETFWPSRSAPSCRSPQTTNTPQRPVSPRRASSTTNGSLLRFFG